MLINKSKSLSYHRFLMPKHFFDLMKPLQHDIQLWKNCSNSIHYLLKNLIHLARLQSGFFWV